MLGHDLLQNDALPVAEIHGGILDENSADSEKDPLRKNCESPSPHLRHTDAQETADAAVVEERSLGDDSFYDRVDPSRFEKLAVLGEGQYATVYRARDLQEEKTVALKHLRLLTKDERACLGLSDSRSLCEAEILSSLDHPNIVRLFSTFTEGSQQTLVMECMDFSLDQLLKDISVKEFSIGQVAHYVEGMVKGLVYLHKENVIHRDLKPNNVLINVEGDVKLADFGISRRGFDDVKYSRPFACRYYRPPEILLGAKTYNHTVDIWALGCIIGEFYTRNPLFVGNCDLVQLNIIVQALGSPLITDPQDSMSLNLPHCQPQPLSKLVARAHPTMLELLEKCLVIDWQKRLSSQGCLGILIEAKKNLPPSDELPLPAAYKPTKSDITSPRKKRSSSCLSARKSGASPLNLSLCASDENDLGDSPLKKPRTPGTLREAIARSNIRRRLF